MLKAITSVVLIQDPPVIDIPRSIAEGNITLGEGSKQQENLEPRLLQVQTSALLRIILCKKRRTDFRVQCVTSP